MTLSRLLLIVCTAYAGGPVFRLTELEAQAPRPCRMRAAVGDPDTVVRIGSGVTPSIRPVTKRGPRYPNDLRAMRVNGSVTVSFTIDTLGVVIPGSEIIDTESQRGFGDAVCAWMKTARFTPFRANGRTYIARILNEPFTFTVSP